MCAALFYANLFALAVAVVGICWAGSKNDTELSARIDALEAKENEEDVE
jgi:uncharacterized membrane protein YfbV (UPF0208 family)